MIPDGVGELYIAYEQLKKQLEEEGLFRPEYKKPIPKFPKRVGVVTASTGAAVRDIINVITRRYPMAEIVIYPAQVQGVGAAESVVKAIEYFNATNEVDTLIVGRGGGSIEDLWAFNEEITARAIFNSKIPIISAVGHETDFTIADFVSDLRAPTPSAAAELATTRLADKKEDARALAERLERNLQAVLTVSKRRLEFLIEELAATCSLPVSHGTLHHVAEVVELMAQVFLHAPSSVASPEVRMLWVLGAGCVEISIRLLSLTDDVEHTVDISLEFLVWIGLEHVASALDSLVWVGIIEAVRHQLAHVVTVARVSGALKVLVSALCLALAESQRDGYLARGLDTLSPERIVPNLY